LYSKNIHILYINGMDFYLIVFRKLSPSIMINIPQPLKRARRFLCGRKNAYFQGGAHALDSQRLR